MASVVFHQLPTGAGVGVGTLPSASGRISSSVLPGRSIGGRVVVVVHGGVQDSWVLGKGRSFRQSGRIFSGNAVMRGTRLGWEKVQWQQEQQQQPTWRTGAVVMAAETSPEDSSSGIAVEDAAEDNDAGEDDESIEEEDDQLSPEEEEDQQNIDDILRVVELLKTNRDMTFNEAKLTISIEDPRDVERRRMLNIEDDRGCSREDLGNALLEVYEGRVPKDRLVLRELAKEMLNWPNVDEDLDTAERTAPVASPYAKATDTGVDPKVAAERANVEWDSASDYQPGQEKESKLPPAVGISFLYLVSSIPIIIGVTVVAILFFNSLQ